MKLLENLQFSKKEALNLLISTTIMGFIFSYRKWYSLSTKGGISRSLGNLLISIILVGFSFLIHELIHKIFALKYDCKAEYRLLPKFLLFSLAITLLSGGRILFAIPGFVAISSAYFTRLGYKSSDITLEEEGKISMVGPLSSLALAFLFKLSEPLLSKNIANLGVTINTWLAFLNSLPIPPLDGSRVLMFSRIVYIILISSTFLALVFLNFLPSLVALGLIIGLVGFLFIWGNLKGI